MAERTMLRQEVWLVPQLAAELRIPANPTDREPEPNMEGSGR